MASYEEAQFPRAEFIGPGVRLIDTWPGEEPMALGLRVKAALRCGSGEVLVRMDAIEGECSRERPR